MKPTDRHKLAEWQKLVENIQRATAVDFNESPAEQRARVARLEADPEAWFAYYFPNYYTSEPAKFHINASRRILRSAEWYEVRNWSRELAKSARSMMEDLYLLLTGVKKSKLLISASWDAAEKLMQPYVANLEYNERIINDYGAQKRLGSWVAGDIATKSGFSIVAVGAGQSPRGTRKEAVRPDIIEFDDFDTDEECRNIDIIDKKWKWVNEAVIPTKSISKPTLIRWNGNLIAEDCCIARARKMADHVSQVNIRDEQGNSTWPQKNSEEHIDRTLSIIPYSAQQKEYFNNPISEGKTFPEMSYKTCPRRTDLPCLVIYADPGTSNKDKPSIKSGKMNSPKAVVVLGRKGADYYVYKCWVDHASNHTFIQWLYEAWNYCQEVSNNKLVTYCYIENNSLQDPFYEQVLQPLIYEQSKTYGYVLPHLTDGRKKPDKFIRIEGALEPINRLGHLFLNKSEIDSPHMQRLEAQFKSVSPNSKTMDGPDAVEGAKYYIDLKHKSLGGSDVTFIKRKKNSKRI